MSDQQQQQQPHIYKSNNRKEYGIICINKEAKIQSECYDNQAI